MISLLLAALVIWFAAGIGLLRLVLSSAGVALALKGEDFVPCMLIYAAIWPETLHD